jgi:hypothetical protein
MLAVQVLVQVELLTYEPDCHSYISILLKQNWNRPIASCKFGCWYLFLEDVYIGILD